ncbi:hypothetical protein ACJ3XI_03610 [Litorimonas sp. RW-G-Af-16]|uniref:hypothetical protein n=1 Tax=Litorimonas sp. RW-G-Af-16 TaxID=3241168 RepID=UPI00390C7829
MTRRLLTLAIAASFVASLSGQTQAQDSQDPIYILLNEAGLDLSNPDQNATLKPDRAFKSNDPRMKSRVYKVKNGPRVKLVGHKFDDVSQIDQISLVYGQENGAYDTAKTALTAAFGAPSAKRPNIHVWRLKNTAPTSTQSDTIKVISSTNTRDKFVITADRQLGGKGNNPRIRQSQAPAPKIASKQAAPAQIYRPASNAVD